MEEGGLNKEVLVKKVKFLIKAQLKYNVHTTLHYVNLCCVQYNNDFIII